jgi:prevent-host-death family protein
MCGKGGRSWAWPHARQPSAVSRRESGVVSLPGNLQYGYNSHKGIHFTMRSVNVAELKNHLSKYLTFAKGGEEIVIRDRNLPVAKLIPFSSDEASDEELLLVAVGKMRVPKTSVNVHKLLKIPTGKVDSSEGIQALLNERDEGL